MNAIEINVQNSRIPKYLWNKGNNLSWSRTF